MCNGGGELQRRGETGCVFKVLLTQVCSTIPGSRETMSPRNLLMQTSTEGKGTNNSIPFYSLFHEVLRRKACGSRSPCKPGKGKIWKAPTHQLDVEPSPLFKTHMVYCFQGVFKRADIIVFGNPQNNPSEVHIRGVHSIAKKRRRKVGGTGV